MVLDLKALCCVCVCVFFLIQMIFIYIVLNHNNSCLKALYIMR